MGPLTDDEFARRIREAYPNALSYAKYLTKCAVDAEDVAQDAMLKAWERRAQFDTDTNFGGWITTIVHRCFLDSRRCAKRRPVMYLAELPAAEAPERADDSLFVSELGRAVDRLPDRQREVMLAVMRKSYADVAEDLHIKPVLVRKAVCAGRKRLKELVA